MKVLIIGLGYAGNRFRRAFEGLWEERGERVGGRIAYVGRTRSDEDLPYYSSVASGIARHRPDVVVLSVNDVYRAEVSKELAGFTGFVICEKPFVCPWDDLDQAARHFSMVSGFCLNVIERYSAMSEMLLKFVRTHELELLRANFMWGKDRLGDHRPTCGVTSEIIHPLDLIQHVSDIRQSYRIDAAHCVQSDFSISGSAVSDSVSILGKLGGAVVSGYASFVNVSRHREIGYVFARRTGEIVYAKMVFDDPQWDDDHLQIWQRAEEHALVDERVVSPEVTSNGMRLMKITRLVSDVSASVHGFAPRQAFPDLSAAIKLQRTLNTIHDRAAKNSLKVFYSRYGKVAIAPGTATWEKLG